MRTRQYSHFAAQRPDIEEPAAIATHFFIQDADSERLLLKIIEGLRDLERGRVRVLSQDCLFYFAAQRIDCFAASDLPRRIKGGFNAVASNLISNLQEIISDREPCDTPFRFTCGRGQLFCMAVISRTNP